LVANGIVAKKSSEKESSSSSSMTKFSSTSLLLNGLEGSLSPSSPPLLPALVPDAPDPDGQKMPLPPSAPEEDDF
jgi:hypothetical protein